MNKTTLLLVFAFCILSLANVSGAYSTGKVDVVVAGYINHGPMQPSITAIKEVTSKYGDQVSVTWVDLGTAEGQKYFDEHDLSAHLNILINGRYQWLVNGRKVTFQWFVGQQWTENVLDAVLSGVLNNSPNVTPLANTQSGYDLFGVVMAFLWPLVILAAAITVSVLYLVRRSRRRRTKPNGIGKR